MGTLNLWLSAEDEARMRRQMEIAGESQLGPHIKRVYFGNLNPGEGVLPELRKNSEMALSMLANLAKKGASSTGDDKDDSQDRDLELRLLAAIYLMLHMSVGRDNRAMIDRYLDHKAIDTFFKSGGEL